MRTFSHWDIAFRIGKTSPFQIVAPPPFGWIADPFLVEFRGETYLFAEIFLYLSERNGVIGYCKYDGEQFSDWTVTMDCHWHLSYPYVFVDHDDLYMIPESYQLKEVNVYRLVSFPDKWEKIRSLIMNVEYCDSTFLDYSDGNRYMFTFEKGANAPEGKGLLYKIENGCCSNFQFLSDELEGARCAGKVISKDGKYIRVGQNCKKEYGGGLIFYEIDSVFPRYSEHEIYRIDPNEIIIDSPKEYCGVHTFNVLGDMEVIDLKYKSTTAEENEASERVRKVFMNKYES